MKKILIFIFFSIFLAQIATSGVEINTGTQSGGGTNNYYNNITNIYVNGSSMGNVSGTGVINYFAKWISSNVIDIGTLFENSTGIFTNTNITANWFFGKIAWSDVQNPFNYTTPAQTYTDALVVARNNSWVTTFNATYDRLLGQNCPVGQVLNGTLINGTFICVTPTAIEVDPVFVNQNSTIWTAINSKASSIWGYNQSLASFNSYGIYWYNQSDALRSQYVSLWYNMTTPAISYADGAFLKTGENTTITRTTAVVNQNMNSKNITAIDVATTNRICFNTNCSIYQYNNGTALITHTPVNEFRMIYNG